MAEYSRVDKLLHRIACGSTSVAEFSFDLEQKRFAAKAPDSDAAHVFVCGLARSGTTILLRNLYGSGAFCSLTYRDMPFVLAPNSWASMTSKGHKKMEAAERAHQDGIKVDFDSPEALDEIFWRVFSGSDYIRPDSLVPMTADAEVIEKFRRYVAVILLRYGKARYLSKGNNNILRLDALTNAFPKAHVVMPIRDPLAHATSLMRQHELMAEMNASDRFSGSYMRWLAHFEFGGDHRPFAVGSRTLPEDHSELEYWLTLWCNVYEHLTEKARQNSALIPVCYEDLCSDPEVFAKICSVLGVSSDAAETFNLANKAQDESKYSNISRLVEDANQIYSDFRQVSLNAI